MPESTPGETPRERVILVGLETRAKPPRAGRASLQTPEESLEELATLARSAGGEVRDMILQSLPAPQAATLIGSGKVAELAARVAAEHADLVIFDHELTPTQFRNLEKQLNVRVVDRTQLILDIFASRARTREGQLQVELAQLNYVLPRLTGRGIEMSRLGGGIGTRGPGETQLETDRRRIFRRLRKIERDLESVRSSRSTQRRLRREVPLATVSLVGYTNAGKSTLFNALTGAGVTADARMFATLDPTVRPLTLPSRRKVLLSDTVGFIRALPTPLIRAFRATLEEVKESSLLLHVVDVTSPQAAQLMAHVHEVLSEIGAESTPRLLVLNKADQLAAGSRDADVLRRRLAEESGLELNAAAVVISARTGAGLDRLAAAVDESLAWDPVQPVTFRFALDNGASIHAVHEQARVLEVRYTGEHCEIDAEAPESLRRRLKHAIVGEKA